MGTAAEGERVWGDLYGFVYRYLRRRGLSPADAEDIAQDTLESAFVHLEGIDPGKLHAWLLAVARNKLVDRARRSARVVSVADVPERADTDEDPLSSMLGADREERLHEAIEGLPDRERRLIELRYIEERSLADTAEAVGSSVGATKVALFRARKRLRSVLEDEEDD